MAVAANFRALPSRSHWVLLILRCYGSTIKLEFSINKNLSNNDQTMDN